MSSRTQASSTQSGPFKELIQRDSDICNNCFRKTHQTVERNYAKRTFINDDGKSDIWWEEVDLPSMRFTRTDEVTHMYSDRDDGQTVRSCKCGMRNIPLRPVSLDNAMSYAKRVSERLTEKCIDFDRDVLLDCVREDMQKPENQCRLDTVLGDAVRRAIRGDTHV